MSRLLSLNTLLHTTPPPIQTQFTVPSITTVHSTSWTLKSTNPIRISTGSSKRTSTVKCMANPRRVKMVAKQIRRELSDMMLTDKVLQFAVLPEAALGADRYLSSLTTISDRF